MFSMAGLTQLCVPSATAKTMTTDPRIAVRRDELLKQYKDRLLKRDAEMRDREQINRELERQRERNVPLPTTAPNAISAPQPATAPAPAAAAPAAAANAASGTGVARPPATQSGSDTPDVK